MKFPVNLLTYFSVSGLLNYMLKNTKCITWILDGHNQGQKVTRALGEKPQKFTEVTVFICYLINIYSRSI